ncbi:EscI/YscI/HrpB family type III secretion system inner rod protein, partial [Pseudomonas aeruginosa]|nr:EscI/YscI/HrpB family type III secretion system inner rod protein [Pseudomonas aeruginosa]
MSRIDTPPGFAVYPSASPKAANLPAVDQVLAFEQALGDDPNSLMQMQWSLMRIT